ncbi:MAG: hypothetical protein ACW98X_16720 [Promethearchaeota archaeon]|jgi:hypothetical protein
MQCNEFNLYNRYRKKTSILGKGKHTPVQKKRSSTTQQIPSAIRKHNVEKIRKAMIRQNKTSNNGQIFHFNNLLVPFTSIVINHEANLTEEERNDVKYTLSNCFQSDAEYIQSSPLDHEDNIIILVYNNLTLSFVMQLEYNKGKNNLRKNYVLQSICSPPQMRGTGICRIIMSFAIQTICKEQDYIYLHIDKNGSEYQKLLYIYGSMGFHIVYHENNHHIATDNPYYTEMILSCKSDSYCVLL